MPGTSSPVYSSWFGRRAWLVRLYYCSRRSIHSLVLSGGELRAASHLFFSFFFLLGFLLFRVLKIGSDSRFDTIRAHFFKFLGTFEPRNFDLDMLFCIGLGINLMAY
jgi:hypothetical protein